MIWRMAVEVWLEVENDSWLRDHLAVAQDRRMEFSSLDGKDPESQVFWLLIESPLFS